MQRTNMNFGEAIIAMKHGFAVRREGWNNSEAYCKLWMPDYEKEKPDPDEMTHPYIYIEYPAGSKAYTDGVRVPWLASQTDMLTPDWKIVD